MAAAERWQQRLAPSVPGPIGSLRSLVGLGPQGVVVAGADSSRWDNAIATLARRTGAPTRQIELVVIGSLVHRRTGLDRVVLELDDDPARGHGVPTIGRQAVIEISDPTATVADVVKRATQAMALDLSQPVHPGPDRLDQQPGRGVRGQLRVRWDEGQHAADHTDSIVLLTLATTQARQPPSIRSSGSDLDRQEADTFVEQLLSLAADLAASPSALWRDIPLRSACGDLVRPRLEQPLPPPPPRDLRTWIAGALGGDPDAPAVESSSGTLTRGELHRRVSQLVAQLRVVGDKRLVAISVERGLHLPEAVLACILAQRPFVVLDAAHGDTRNELLLRTSRSGLVIGCDERSTQTAARLALTHLDCRDGSVTVGGPSEPWEEPADHLTFTSGTTGHPRGIRGNLEAVAHFLEWAVTAHSIGSGERFSVLAGLGHDPLLRELLLPVVTAGVCVIPSPDQHRDLLTLASWLQEHRLAVVHATPSLLRAAAQHALRIDGVRIVALTGEPLDQPTHQRIRTMFPNARVVSYYGTTETPQAMAVVDLTEDVHRLGSIGRPIDDEIQIAIVTPTGRHCDIGEIGEIVVRTSHLSHGTLDDDQRGFGVNPLRGDPSDRIYRTGDSGWYCSDGEIMFSGRLDRQLTRRGARVEPSEVEAVIRSVDGVVNCAVAIVDVGGQPQLVCYLQGPAGVGSVLEACRSKLAPHAVPARVVPVASIEVTPNGKVDIGRTIQTSIRLGRTVTPVTSTEQALFDLWRRVLGHHDFTVDDHFSDIGGDSILALTMVSELAAETGHELPLAVVAGHGSIRSIGQYIDGWRDGTWSPVVALDVADRSTVLVLVHSAGGNVIGYHQLGRALGRQIDDLDIVAIQSPVVQGRIPAQRTMRQLLALYGPAVAATVQERPVVVAGYSSGATIARHLAQWIVEHQGLDVRSVIEIDGFPPGDERPIAAHGADVGHRPTTRRAELTRRIRRRRQLLAFGRRIRLHGPVPLRDRAYLGVLVHWHALRRRAGTGPWTGRALLIRSAHFRAMWPDELWGPDAVIAHVEGHHSTLLRPPVVQAVAQCCARELSDCFSEWPGNRRLPTSPDDPTRPDDR